MYRITVVHWKRPWWGLGIFGLRTEVRLTSPPGVSWETANRMRRLILSNPNVESAILETIEDDE